MECSGIVGVLKLFSNSYLFVITRSEHRGDLLGPDRPVYCCTGVCAIPLTQEGASRVLKAEALQARNVTSSDRTSRSSSDSGDSSDSDSSDSDDVRTPSVLTRESFLASAKSSSLPNSRTIHSDKVQPAGDARKPESRQSDTATPDDSIELPASVKSKFEGKASQDAPDAEKVELEDKLVKEAARQWARGEMFFAYGFDLTTPLQRKEEKQTQASQRSDKASATYGLVEPQSSLPLWRRADRRFFHNEHMVQDFVQAGLHSMILPLMQGYFQVSDLPLTGCSDTSAQIMVISRRSRERPGLRYQRRGVNDKGQVANFVETEQILAVRRENASHIFSFVQFRGSIPLYWSQSPFALKPPPQLERSQEENDKACSNHFTTQVERYGKVTCINLAEQAGKEGEITEAYRRAVSTMSNDAVQYVPFDFHKECSGMKFENISKLIENVRPTIEAMDCFWQASGLVSGEHAATDPATTPNGILSQQSGAFRVSCLDCLDRTNVVQSAFARHMVYQQLARVGIAKSPVDKDEAFDFAFNDMWANNGDQISRIYAGSRALKGDFTRTGRRNWVGMFNDATNSVYRMIQGAVTDFWRQTVISFIYGELSLSGLEKYAEQLETFDPSKETRLARIRAAAIETSAGMVLSRDEVRIGGWTLFGPHETGTVQSSKLEEKVVLLTSAALYICAYDFTVQKLSEFSKILLGDITGIKKGLYVISPRDGYHPDDHWGLMVSYINESTRTNAASIKNVPQPTSTKLETNFLALKAVAHEFAGTIERERFPPVQNASGNSTLRRSTIIRQVPDDPPNEGRFASSNDATGLTSQSIVDAITQMLVEECTAVGACSSEGQNDEGGAFVSEGSIQSLSEAKARAPMFSGLVEGLKRRVWL
ncbi:unnamed protein product [Jaminaea pallidilutea]